MANLELPSFSLGFDTPPHSPINEPPSPALHVSDSDSDPQSRPDPPRSILKRLRRGPPSPPPSVHAADDDDIEDFSSPERPHQVHPPAPPSAWNRSVCSTSKVSLSGCGALISTPRDCRERKRKEPSGDVPCSSRLETGKSGLMFPKLTTSPLRRFQLLDSDSDSDDSDLHVGAGDGVNPNNRFEQNKNTSFGVDGDRDLWKDFSLVKNVSVPTPVFNELCEEYFSSAKCNEVEGHVGYPGVSSSFQMDQQQRESTDPVHPAHRYFFHEDARIRQLVCSRLRNFKPLGVGNRVNQQPNVSHIDYMGQFGNGGASNMRGVQSGFANKSSNFSVEGSFNASGGWVDPKVVSPFSHGESSRRKATARNSTKNSVSKGKSKANKSNTANLSGAPAGWVEPKSCTSLPKDAGKRRVQASGESAGHWYTSPEGRKVYVNKSGQELTGRGAYRQYRKESGAGFKKSKKKTGAKKTNTKKRN
ncbi:hypothetical protein Fmac_030639 [Flemingia macrophylla]|uniref:Uncharacterized protein n=1 Tax=Flemingia macrophylla TaxID=520843 RepID=A0ABD1L079_9FABA